MKFNKNIKQGRQHQCQNSTKMEMGNQRKRIQNRFRNCRKFIKIDLRDCLGGLLGPSWRLDNLEDGLDKLGGFSRDRRDEGE